MHDPVLGELRWLDDEGWHCDVTLGGEHARIRLGGTDPAQLPDRAVIEHARDIVRDPAHLEHAVRELVEDLAAREPSVAAELRALHVDVIWLSAERPDGGMIFFRGPNDAARLWRCDYVGRRPRCLDFDD